MSYIIQIKKRVVKDLKESKKINCGEKYSNTYLK